MTQQTPPYTENKNEQVSNIEDQLTQLSASDQYDPLPSGRGWVLNIPKVSPPLLVRSEP
jgi:hypothetical protein